MDKTRADTVNAFNKQRHDFMDAFLKANVDTLAERMQKETVSTVMDPDEDVLTLVVGAIREAVSFSADGELYLRTDPNTHELVSAELHCFTDNMQKRTAPFRLMLSLLTLTESTRLTILSHDMPGSTAELRKNMRALVEA
jgi:hypothetical protein